MVLELLFVFLLIIGLCVVVYRGAIHEFQILQKTYSPDIPWSELLSEQLPIVIRNLPRHLLGNWTAGKTGNKTWMVMINDEYGKRFRTTWNKWLEAPRDTIENMDELAEACHLDDTIINWTTEECRRWSWLPPSTPIPHVLRSTLGVRKTTAEYTAIVSTDGEPLELWIAHEGAISGKVAPLLSGRDPWNATSDEIPWINTVKYIEIKLRPGNAVLLPCHWWYAVRPSSSNSPAWCWIGQFHTPVSRIATALKNDSRHNSKKQDTNHEL
jgi:hypothetical protein